MKLTPVNKAHIDSMSYKYLLYFQRLAEPGDTWFEGETGEYWQQRIEELRKNMMTGEIIHISTTVGWKKHE